MLDLANNGSQKFPTSCELYGVTELENQHSLSKCILREQFAHTKERSRYTSPCLSKSASSCLSITVKLCVCVLDERGTERMPQCLIPSSIALQWWHSAVGLTIDEDLQ